MTVVAPIITTDFHRSTLRFFRSPQQGEHMPWHCWDDMGVCLGFPRNVRRTLRERLRNDPEWKNRATPVGTPTGIVTIAPHFMAQGLIGSAVDVGLATRATEAAYGRAISDASVAMMGDLPSVERARRLLLAFAREFAPRAERRCGMSAWFESLAVLLSGFAFAFACGVLDLVNDYQSAGLYGVAVGLFWSAIIFREPT